MKIRPFDIFKIVTSFVKKHKWCTGGAINPKNVWFLSRK
jgi:hypothetical protein